MVLQGLVNGRWYTVTVNCTNAVGTSLPSLPSNAVKPAGGRSCRVADVADADAPFASFLELCRCCVFLATWSMLLALATRRCLLALPLSCHTSRCAAVKFGLLPRRPCLTARALRAIVPFPPSALLAANALPDGISVAVFFAPPASDGGEPIIDFQGGSDGRGLWSLRELCLS